MFTMTIPLPSYLINLSTYDVFAKLQEENKMGIDTVVRYSDGNRIYLFRYNRFLIANIVGNWC